MDFIYSSKEHHEEYYSLAPAPLISLSWFSSIWDRLFSIFFGSVNQPHLFLIIFCLFRAFLLLATKEFSLTQIPLSWRSWRICLSSGLIIWNLCLGFKSRLILEGKERELLLLVDACHTSSQGPTLCCLTHQDPLPAWLPGLYTQVTAQNSKTYLPWLPVTSPTDTSGWSPCFPQTANSFLCCAFARDVLGHLISKWPSAECLSLSQTFKP